MNFILNRPKRGCDETLYMRPWLTFCAPLMDDTMKPYNLLQTEYYVIHERHPDAQ